METNQKQLSIGEVLPNLELPAFYQNKEVVLKTTDYADKWKIFFFYPADFTFVCPTELEELASMYSDFSKEQAEIFSISTDTVYAHKAWHDTSPAIKNITFPMVGDPTGNLCRLFGTYIESEGLSLRGTFIVSPDNHLMTIEIHNNSIGRSGKELLRKLRAAKFVAEHGGNVCPASWEPGKESLTPGMDLVGKI